ncbi:MAG: hypothetical protein M0R06_17655 [Sphaerochaeta sp.]|jgi:hypothetical protein|nr:hypothetical protein [Sphaerochaeta sp.]
MRGYDAWKLASPDDSKCKVEGCEDPVYKRGLCADCHADMLAAKADEAYQRMKEEGRR